VRRVLVRCGFSVEAGGARSSFSVALEEDVEVVGEGGGRGEGEGVWVGPRLRPAGRRVCGDSRAGFCGRRSSGVSGFSFANRPAQMGGPGAAKRRRLRGVVAKGPPANPPPLGLP
jgi:hypothetical protein